MEYMKLLSPAQALERRKIQIRGLVNEALIQAAPDLPVEIHLVDARGVLDEMTEEFRAVGLRVQEVRNSLGPEQVITRSSTKSQKKTGKRTKA